MARAGSLGYLSDRLHRVCPVLKFQLSLIFQIINLLDFIVMLQSFYDRSMVQTVMGKF